MAILAGDGAADRGVRAARARADDATGARRRAQAARRSRIVAEAAGAAGMVGGQAIDLAWSGQGGPQRRRLPRRPIGCSDMHARKTGALIRASAVAARSWPAPSDDAIAAVDAYAAELGLAFQIVDDMLDVEGARRRSARPPARMPRPASRPIRRSRPRRDRGAGRGVPSREREAAPRAAPGCRHGLDLRRSSPHWVGSRDSELKTRVRLDTLLVERGLAPSRERARALILAGQVARRRASGRRRPAPPSPPTPTSSCIGPIIRTSAAAALKLAHALDTFAHRRDRAATRSTSARRPAASPTCCCSAARAHVVALDVGHGQIDWRLRNDPRVRRARGRQRPPLTPGAAAGSCGRRDHRRLVHLAAATSCRRVPPLLRPGADVVALVKPQFEAGREEVGKAESFGRRPSTRASWLKSTAAALG